MRRNISTRTATSYFSRSLVACIALVLALPSVALAETDYGKIFFGIPLSSSPEDTEKLMSTRLGVAVKTSRNHDGTTSLRGNFASGTEEARFRDGKIVLIQHKAGPIFLKSVRGVDTFFFNKLGPIAFLKLYKAEHFFVKSAFDGCLNKCNPQCGQHAPSAYYCDAGRACQAACLTQTLPRSPADLQNFLFEQLPKDGSAEYTSFWPCGKQAKTTRIALDDPSGCLMRLRVYDCVGDARGPPEKVGCLYDMLYVKQ